jgi:hypothetical protein
MCNDVKAKRVNPLSWQSLLIKTNKSNCFIGQGSGFVVKHNEAYYLITNWHVLTHRDPISGGYFSSEGDIPSVVDIYHHVAGEPNKWIQQGEQLFNMGTGTQRWIEKKRDPFPGYVDIAALPLKGVPPGCSSIKLCPLDLSSMAREEDVSPGMLVYIIGYLQGINAGSGELIGGMPHGGWPIWITGHIAADPGLDYHGRPVYLINASTGGGLSGAPVFIKAEGKMKFIGVHSSGITSRYSGRRIEGMGEVWKASLIKDILESA